MATGDINDIATRINSVMPHWFANATNPIYDGIRYGMASGFAFIYSLYQYAILQTRIKTATDGWLDMIAADFFGSAIIRASNQTDTSFRNKILVNLFQAKATRSAINKVLFNLTGRYPKFVEPQQPIDTGAYGVSTSGYGAAGAYGSVLMPFQALIQAYRPLGSGIPSVAGYGSPSGGYGQASQAEYATIAQVTSQVSDADIYNAIESVRPAGTITWVQISS